ncbi:MAG: GMC family oxidoreductase [Gemmatimonadetes bacterium]|nr:GMC family oxidoreductase [Gemmatimonadota bacterium]
MTRQDRTFDAIVVGSGMTGGWAAMEFCRKGLRTLCLEAGRPIDPAKEYVEHVHPWELKFRGRGDKQRIAREQPEQKYCYACDEWSGKFFVNDLENPYTYPADRPFRWIRGRHVGGRSIMWGRHVYRWSDLDFEANAKDGHGNDWPIRYADIAPWYDHVERFIGICGQAEGLAQLPDGQFLPPMSLNVAEQAVRERLMSAFGGQRVMTPGRCAVITQRHNGRSACHYCGHCEAGCVTRSYFSSVNVTLPAAQATGKLTLRTHSVVESVVYDARTGKARGVRVIDANTGEATEYQGRVVFLCASALESVRLLLNSRSTRWPEGLANSSGLLGKYIMDHTMGAGARGRVEGFENRREIGRRPHGFYLPRFANVKSSTPDFLRGFAYQGGASRADWNRGSGMPGFGAEFKRALIQDLAPWEINFYGFGECLPRVENHVRLDAVKKDRWGIPALHIDVTYGPNEEKVYQVTQDEAARMLEAAGVKDIRTYREEGVYPGLVIHEMGGARMARTSRDGVLNQWNQCWDVPNLFVTDGACMASSANQNPSITYMALTARAVDHAVASMNRNEL